MKILVVEDEAQLAFRLERALKRAGHETERVGDGTEALRAALNVHYDLVLLDVNLPGCDGFEVLRTLREKSVPSRVLMLTARSEIDDRVNGLKAGADDYLTKPFAMEELLARIEVLGRRDSPEVRPILEAGGLCMDVVKRRLTQCGERVELSQRAFEVLEIFMREPGRVFSRAEICERVWEREHEYDTRTVEIFVMRLRKKLDLKRCGLKIETVWGVGYVLKLAP